MKIGVITTVGSSMFVWVSYAPEPRERGPGFRITFLVPTPMSKRFDLQRPNLIWEHVGQERVLGVICAPPQGERGLSVPKF